MDKNKANVPKIRFPGFTVPWEQHKLGDESMEIVAGGDIDKNKIVDSGKYPVLANALTNDGIVGYYKNDFRIKAPAVTVTGRGDVGHAKARKVDFTPVVRLLAVKTKHDVDFLENAINKHEVLVESTGVPQLTVPQLSKYKIYFPKTDDEEKVMGVFFKDLDNLITIHQRKLNHLQDKKKSLLQKMFPKNGEDFPELRFPGFTHPWEQRKFSDTFTNIPNNTLARAELNYNSGLAKNVHYGDVLIKFGELLDVEKDEIPYITDGALVNKFRSSKLQNGDVIIADAAEDETVGKCTELVNVGEKIVISGLHTIPCRPTLSFASGYLGYFMNSYAYHNQLLRLMQGTKVSSISKSALQDTFIFHPFDIVEQKKISELFQQLNKLITLHQRKLNHLQEQKKALLQQMFI
ncbi:restriction endonuclease subunit S [Clostridium tyrobutyricum]|uniref:Type I restriction-modification system, specificity subunit S n=1 Tax=Clostridium tyrobutyricum DIVETGP TaxID=1408889 RepID=W6N6I1_CLOTY|nr:restriction endonuclease subunit S [Clostridium tyrobutyricum]AND86003.1 type I restriction enzyme, S subunit [Clostridium tyrobutyricum]MBV4434922.1 restriction endonuclease subunit S [Clostridium tyrobutyricum]QNB67865.1 restriction endonuclease subunit S [Clostridium tyrobutyricum]CDL90889.1 Type I restriction-modification system, specificity subunit S [Clostridium tyrobutyricum DIVETGP]